MNINCVICGEPIDIEHPESVYGTNPETLRKGWQHSFCNRTAVARLAEQPANSVLYQNRQEEYIAWVNRAA